MVGEKAKKSYMTPDAIAEFVNKLSKLATDQKSTEDAKKMEIAARKRAVLGNTLEK